MDRIMMEKRTYRLTGLAPMLGSQPANQDVRTAYIASKAPKEKNVSDEEEYLPDERDKDLTVFLRDPRTGGMMLLDYMVKAFFKSALGALGAQNGIKQAAGKVDKFVFIEPRRVLITRDGEPITEVDEICERPLRAKTMQGERTALRASEQIDTPWQIEVGVTLLPNTGSKLSSAVTWDALECALDYGRLSGIGQWRNAGYGQFTWERVK